MTRSKVKPESAADRARRLWDGNPESTARKLLEELFTEQEPGAIEVLLSWVTDRVRALIRTEVRRGEQDAWEAPAGRPTDRVAREIRSQAGALPEIDNLAVLLKLPVLVPLPGRGTHAVPWGQMTAADHEARIGLLRRPAKSVQEAIDRHQWSIDEIRKYGVSCLADIDLSVLRADMSTTAIGLQPARTEEQQPNRNCQPKRARTAAMREQLAKANEQPEHPSQPSSSSRSTAASQGS